MIVQNHMIGDVLLSIRVPGHLAERVRGVEFLRAHRGIRIRRGVDERDVVAHQDLAHEQDLSLARLAADGDDGAWRSLVDQYADACYRLIAAMGFWSEREDLLQDIFIKLFRGLGGYKGRAALKTWILRIARNHLLNHARRYRNRRIWEVPDIDVGDADSATCSSGMTVHASSTAAIDRLARRQLALKVFFGLEEKQRVVLMLIELGNCSYEEAAGILGVSTGTVKSRVHRARARIQEQLNEFDIQETRTAALEPRHEPGA